MMGRRLTLPARGVVLLLALAMVNVVLWVITAVTFTVFQHRERGSATEGTHKAVSLLHDNAGDVASTSGSLLSLALVAWTTGLRHALDADHISAIDNATRRIMAVPRRDGRGFRRPVTVGLFFSLGHSTIVVAVLIAVAVSFTVYANMGTVSDVGSVIGASISGAFLFLVGVINTVILVHTWRLRPRRKQLDAAETAQGNGAECPTHSPTGAPPTGEGATPPTGAPPTGDEGTPPPTSAAPPTGDEGTPPPAPSAGPEFRGLFTRLAWPLLRIMDRPWKMYIVGILFGLGFDTASTIALLGIAVIASSSLSGESSANGSIVLLAFLFTAGMTVVDSFDAVLMVCAYAWEELEEQDKWYAVFTTEHITDEERGSWMAFCARRQKWRAGKDDAPPVEGNELRAAEQPTDTVAPEDLPLESDDTDTPVPRSDVAHEIIVSTTPFAMFLTLLSIIIAFVVSIIEILGLTGDRCSQCSDAADRQEASHDGGLAGRWWLWWRWCNDYFGYIGAGIAAIFFLCVIFALAVTIYHARKRRRKQRAQKVGTAEGDSEKGVRPKPDDAAFQHGDNVSARRHSTGAPAVERDLGSRADDSATLTIAVA
ncbi:hypothetical protein MSPP1_001188 [Malassezia sp. CBS 17886]|nr:hypothetical protein MSPP1_001188 [Malassezia sp. CBS 17886]